MTSGISVEKEVNGAILPIRIPVHRRIHSTRVGIEIMDERGPHASHHRTKIIVRLRNSGKRFPVVISDAVDIVEHHREFLEMGCAGQERCVCCVYIEAVAVGWCACFGPGFALAASVGVHGEIAGEGTGASPFPAIGGHSLVAQEFWDTQGWVVGV